MSEQSLGAGAGTPGAAERGLGEAAGELRRQGEQIAEMAKDAGRSAAERGKSDAASYLRDVASALHSGAQELRNRQHGFSADCLERAADGLAEMGADFGGQEIGELGRRADRLARERPMLTAALGLAAGFALVRLARSDSMPPRRPLSTSPEETSR